MGNNNLEVQDIQEVEQGGVKAWLKEVFGPFNICLAILLVLVLLFNIFFQLATVNGHSMDNSLSNDQLLLEYDFAYKFGANPQYKDIVIIDVKDESDEVDYIIKRVIGVPGDTIAIKDNKVYRNENLLHEGYIKEEMENNEDMEITVGKDEVWVMGDNRNNSLDSRYYGTFEIEKIHGKIVASLNPFKWTGNLE